VKVIAEPALIPVQDVKAHWAYTEIIGAHSSPAYARYAGVDALRAKRGATVPFGALSEPERAALVVAWHGVRAHYFERYFATVLGYRVAHWTRPQLLSVRVPPRLDTTQSHYPTLLHFFSTQADHPDDPRNAEKEGITIQPDGEPLILGLHNSEPIIGDGLHRARTFQMSALPTTIQVYVPVPVE
jgi:hypothetical protein